MAVQTGADGQLKYNNRTVAKVRDWSVSVQKDVIEDTCLGAYDRTYVEGLRGTSGSATILYDPDDSAATELLNSIFQNNSTSAEVEFILSTKANRALACTGFITSVSPSVSVGAATACSVSFQVSGKPSGGF
jgi:hypothetical protein